MSCSPCFTVFTAGFRGLLSFVCFPVPLNVTVADFKHVYHEQQQKKTDFKHVFFIVIIGHHHTYFPFSQQIHFYCTFISFKGKIRSIALKT